MPTNSVGTMTAGRDVGLLDVVDARHLGHLRRGCAPATIAPLVRYDVVLDVGRGGDQLEVVLALEALAHDVHVQQAEEAAAKAEAERLRALGLADRAPRRSA